MFSIIPSSSQKPLFSNPGLAIKITSNPFLIFGIFIFTIALNLRFILFLNTAFFDTFWETIKPNRLFLKLFLTILNNRKSSLNFRPFLNTLSKSFLCLTRLFFDNTINKNMALSLIKTELF